MTRARKVDPAILEREYIYDAGNPAISITQLAEKHGLARSGVADKAMKGRWFDKRKEFRAQLGERTVAALSDTWVGFETEQREKLLLVGLKYLDRYSEALESGEIKVTTRDMLGMAAMIRTLLGDSSAAAKGEEGTIDPDAIVIDPKDLRAAIHKLDQLESGLPADDEVDADDLAPTGTEDSRPN